jgi:hypothetical protein
MTMGADFIVYCCEDPVDYKKAMPYIEYRIENLSGDLLHSIADDVLCDEAQEISEEVADESLLSEEDLWKLDDLTSIKIKSMIRRRIREAVGEVFDSYRRDVAHMHLHGRNYLMTGGMSWGDLPTEACDLIHLIEYSCVTEGMSDPNFDYESFKA